MAGLFLDLLGTLRTSLRIGKGIVDTSGLTTARTQTMQDRAGSIGTAEDGLVQPITASGVTEVVPATYQKIAYEEYSVDGELQLDGDLIIL